MRAIRDARGLAASQQSLKSLLENPKTLPADAVLQSGGGARLGPRDDEQRQGTNLRHGVLLVGRRSDCRAAGR